MTREQCAVIEHRLHVAAAHAAGCTTLVSVDDRQLAVAKTSGLKIVDIKRGARGKR